jgi:hypothetical protein
VAFTHRKRIILQCGAVYAVRGGEMYRKDAGVIEKGEVGLSKFQEWGKERQGEQLGTEESGK